MQYDGAALEVEEELVRAYSQSYNYGRSNPMGDQVEDHVGGNTSSRRLNNKKNNSNNYFVNNLVTSPKLHEVLASDVEPGRVGISLRRIQEVQRMNKIDYVSPLVICCKYHFYSSSYLETEMKMVNTNDKWRFI